MANKEHIDFLYEKGYTNIEDINNDEINFIYVFEKQNEKEVIEPIAIPYDPVKWYGEKHYEIIMKLFTNLEFVRMENINNNFSEFYIFPILKYKSKNYQINKTPKIIIKKIKKYCNIYLTDKSIPLKYSSFFEKIKKYQGKSNWRWNGDLLLEEDTKTLKEIIYFLIENPAYVGEYYGIF
tara:strand:- start:377 stop:916 length:540 start_codon:yes stop_codon:yes gene_type:complete